MDNPQHKPAYLKAEFPGLVEKGMKDLYNQSIGELFTRLTNDPDYGGKFLTTLEINKVESLNKDINKPKTFTKNLDDLSIVTSYSINDNSIKLKNSFHPSELESIARYLMENHRHGIAHFSLSSIETILSRDFPDFPEQYVLKTVNNLGLVSAIRIHPRLAPHLNAKTDAGSKRVIEEAIKNFYREK